jgi:hypothetical protein
MVINRVEIAYSCSCLFSFEIVPFSFFKRVIWEVKSVRYSPNCKSSIRPFCMSALFCGAISSVEGVDDAEDVEDVKGVEDVEDEDVEDVEDAGEAGNVGDGEVDANSVCWCGL